MLVNKSELNKALVQLNRVVPGKTTYEPFKYIVVYSERKELILTGGNSDRQMKVTIKTQSNERFISLLNFKQLRYAAKIASGKINLKSTENGFYVNNIKIDHLPVNQFISLFDSGVGDWIFSVYPEHANSVLKMANIAIDTKPEYKMEWKSFICVENDGNKSVKFVSTDEFRLIEVDIETEIHEHFDQFFIHVYTWDVIAKSYDYKKNEGLSVHKNDVNVTIRFDNVVIVEKLANWVNFPNYRPALNFDHQNYNAVKIANKNILINAIEKSELNVLGFGDRSAKTDLVFCEHEGNLRLGRFTHQDDNMVNVAELVEPGLFSRKLHEPDMLPVQLKKSFVMDFLKNVDIPFYINIHMNVINQAVAFSGIIPSGTGKQNSCWINYVVMPINNMYEKFYIDYE